MQLFPIIAQTGPLPISTPFTAPLDGPVVLVVTGSLWSQVGNTMLQLNVLLDNIVIGSATVFSNGPDTHRVLPTLFLNVQLSDGSHTLTLARGNPNVTTDQNDSFSAAILY